MENKNNQDDRCGAIFEDIEGNSLFRCNLNEGHDKDHSSVVDWNDSNLITNHPDF